MVTSGTFAGRGAACADTRDVAGAHGSRTHRAARNAAPLVLKTRGPTGTQPLPCSMVARGPIDPAFNVSD
jgi:hypothetical protein